MNYLNVWSQGIYPYCLSIYPSTKSEFPVFSQNSFNSFDPIYTPLTQNYNSFFCFPKDIYVDATTVTVSRQNQIVSPNQIAKSQLKSLTTQKKKQKKDGNTKANIIRDFIRNLKKDATSVLLAKKYLKLEYPIKKFIETLLKYFPHQDKYIRFKQIKDLCCSKEKKEFAALLRTIFLNYLRNDYPIFVVSKKKNKFKYLKVCRELVQKMNKITE